MQGDTTVVDPLLREVLPKLREIAGRELNRTGSFESVCKTELINELWVSSLSKGNWQFNDRGHFFALAGLAMRRVLIDLARKRLSVRRGSGTAPEPLDKEMAAAQAPRTDAEQILAIGLLMDQLEVEDPDAARAVDMHYFSGFTLEEIAKELGLTIKKVRSRWERGLKWLKKRLAEKSRTASGFGGGN